MSSMVSSFCTCSRSSASVMPSRASSVVVHSCFAATRSSPGPAASPLPLLPPGGLLHFALGVQAVLDALASDCFSRDRLLGRLSVDVRGESRWERDGNTQLLLLGGGEDLVEVDGHAEAHEKSRRMRLRIQSAAAAAAAATSWDQSEALRGVRKTGFSLGAGGKEGRSSSSSGRRAFRYGSVTERISSGSRPSKSGIGKGSV